MANSSLKTGITVKLYCCGCQADRVARLTDGAEVYPHRPDLYALPFWKCGTCGNHVGCHHKSMNRTAPLGCIPTPELRAARKHIHAVLDPLWQSRQVSRKAAYAAISAQLGYAYHTAEVRSVAEARRIYRIVCAYRALIQGGAGGAT